MKAREVQWHVQAEVLEDPSAQRLYLGGRIVLSRDQQCRDLKPNLGLVLQISECFEHRVERAGAEFLVKAVGEPLRSILAASILR
jgi:hypothetical protein